MTATIHKVVAGNGYEYYLRNIAALDTDARGRSALADYYSAHGESPGTWYGAGLTALGIVSGAEVTELQMESLFGMGRHPDAERIEEHAFAVAIAAGASSEQADETADKASRLGNPYRVYRVNSNFQKQCAEAFREHNIDHGSDPDAAIPDAVRSQIRTRIAFDMFVDEYNRPPIDARELSGYTAKISRPAATAVAGFDLTFSPVKSVSALWALAPLSIVRKIEAAHQAAIDDALRWLQEHGTFTRLGRNGVRQVDVDGVVAARFAHRDSRAGDPDLHEHILIANRVRTADGRWRTLDGAALYRVVVTVSEIYNTRLEHHLEQLIGVEFAERPGTDPGKRPIREILGIPAQLLRAWSRREIEIRSRTGELAAAFQHEHGREPSSAEIRDLAQRATLETRPAKHGLRSFTEQRQAWRAEAATLLGGREVVAGVVEAALNPIRLRRVSPTPGWIAATANRVLEVVAEHRSTWRVANIRAEVERQIRGKVTGEQWELTAQAVVDAALDPARSVLCGDPDLVLEPELGIVPAVLARHDGASVYTPAGTQLYTSAGILAAEAALIELSVQPGGRSLAPDIVTTAVRDYNTANPERPLLSGQVEVIKGFATSGLAVQSANAPAGSGKTTAMAVLTTAWHIEGGTVLGLAPTANAAAVLRDSIGARCETVDKLLDALTRHTPRPGDPGWEREIPPPLPQWMLDIDESTLVIVDEHVKLGTGKRLRLLQYLTERGAAVRCIGDDHQLPSIEAGGVDADMATAAPEHALTLTHVVRFASSAEATASLGLREGDPAALGWYLDNGRVHAGHLGTVHDDTYTAWTRDHTAGRTAIMLAANHETVTALNDRARTDRLSGTEPGPEVVLADGLSASTGDTVRTRRNNPRLRFGDRDWVRNGYTWTVTAVHDDGAITARHHAAGGASVLLPGDYVAEHVRLGYAATIDSAQGITADSCHVALTGAESRQQLYVAMTRGVHANHLYIPTALDGTEGSFYSEPALFPRTAVELLARVLDRDGTQKSAHTHLRDALDPHRRIARALDIYLDVLGSAAENVLGPDALAGLDAVAESVRAHLTDSSAYPVLRQHLAMLAATGADPVATLRAAAALRELDTAADPAAVLTWRLDPTGTAPATGSGPLPWAPGIPAGLDTAATQADARARIVRELAGQIRSDTTTWTPTTAPVWARPLLRAVPGLLADLAVWRASLGVGERDPRPTGPPRYSRLEREHQQQLDTRVEDALGDLARPATLWAEIAGRIEARILRDPYWPVVAERIDLAARTGIDITGRLTTAAELRPLPDEMPAAALWSRLDLDTSALDGGSTLRPGWVDELPDLLGPRVAEQVLADPAWPRVVAAVDRATGTGWDPAKVIAAAHELLVTATPGDGTGLRPDQIAAALAWRIDALTHPHTDTIAPEFEEPMPPLEPEPPGTALTPPSGHRDPRAPEPTAETDDPVSADLRAITALFHTGAIAEARAKYQHLSTALSSEQHWVLNQITDTLYQLAFPIARARLHHAARQYPQHRELIEACIPVIDPGLHQQDSTTTRRPRDRTVAARDHRNRRDRGLITDSLTDRQERARRDEQTYHDIRAGEDDQPYLRPDSEQIRTGSGAPEIAHIDHQHPHRRRPASYRRDEAPDPVSDGYALDYDHAAAAAVRGLTCVECGIERHRADTIPSPPRRSDDGLCQSCRDDHAAPIPDHDPARHHHARADHLASTKPLATVHAILRRDWRFTPAPDQRAQIEAWVRAHPVPDTEPPYTPPQHDPLFTLTDDELHARIEELEYRLALADTYTDLYTPTQPAPETQHLDTAELRARHRKAQDAIRTCYTADDQLTEANRALHATRSQLATLREQLDTTPARQRRTRHARRTEVEELVNEQTKHEQARRQAREHARDARRHAISQAGPPDTWEQILTTSTDQITAPATAPHSTAAEYHHATEDFLASTANDIDRLRTEQQRRHNLDARQRRIERDLRTRPRETADHTEPDQLPARPGRDTGLGL
ncbi:MobF family relaxase [Nocardia sp. NPDC057227]|uniref:MobF family relaxase n=1 Tax=Nocardia sp. NPDC057227 TaxID=3346056 RepID=UPI00362B547E